MDNNNIVIPVGNSCDIIIIKYVNIFYFIKRNQNTIITNKFIGSSSLSMKLGNRKNVYIFLKVCTPHFMAENLKLKLQNFVKKLKTTIKHKIKFVN